MMRRLALGLFLFLVLLTLHYGGVVNLNFFGSSYQEVEGDESPAPNVTFEEIDGSLFTLEDLRGKVVLINFWASWCAPCVREFPALLKAVEHFQGGVILVALSSDKELDDITTFLDHFREEYGEVLESDAVRIVFDRDSEISYGSFQVVRLPETIVLNQDLQMVKKLIGEVEWDENLRHMLQQFTISHTPKGEEQ